MEHVEQATAAPGEKRSLRALCELCQRESEIVIQLGDDTQMFVCSGHAPTVWWIRP